MLSYVATSKLFLPTWWYGSVVYAMAHYQSICHKLELHKMAEQITYTCSTIAWWLRFSVSKDIGEISMKSAHWERQMQG